MMLQWLVGGGENGRKDREWGMSSFPIIAPPVSLTSSGTLGR